MSVLEFRGVSIVRSRTNLLAGINWVVNEGERWVIIGPNGAGKTTLMQICAAQMFPSKGNAWVLGEQLGRVDVFELRPRIGVSSAAISGHIPASESVQDVVISAAYGVTGRWNENYDAIDYERSEELMFQMRIDHLLNRTFGTLSEGERKRVQIARALMTDPELLLLDEPASGLDLAAREDLVDTISDICEDQLAPTTVMVTHHVEEIPVGITHILMLNRGRLAFAGPIAETLNSYTLSAAFEWPLEINRIDGRWAAHTVRRAGRVM